MPKVREYPFATITEYPELGKKRVLASLLRPLGQITRISQNGYFVTVTIALKRPIKTGVDGIYLNSHTGACFLGSLLKASCLPQEGSETLKVSFDLCLDSRELPKRKHRAGILKDAIKRFAKQASKGFSLV